MRNQSSRSGQHLKVRQAREIARAALGDQARLDAPTGSQKYVGESLASIPQSRPSESIGVWTLGEAAAKLQISKPEVERMIAAGKLRALPTGFTVTVPSVEVEELIRESHKTL
jgi:excisionase family DNA binding protein